jgi:hypothetical protein
MGIVWANDGETFFVHARILGKHLDLRANSIKTNFRNHGFQTIANGHDTDLPECSHWKRRRHPELTPVTTTEEAEQMATTRPSGFRHDIYS